MPKDRLQPEVYKSKLSDLSVYEMGLYNITITEQHRLNQTTNVYESAINFLEAKAPVN